LATNGRSVTRVHISTLAGNGFFVSARVFILATGAIENARLLLLPNNIQAEGTGNQDDRVGRFFMAHIEMGAAFFLPSAQCDMRFFQDKCKLSKRGGWAGETAPILSLSPEIRNREWLLNFTMELSAIPDRDVPNRDLLSNLREVLSTGQEAAPVFRLDSAFETAPNPRSRVTLSNKRDRFNNPVVNLDWQITPLDSYSLKRTYEVLGQEFGGAGLGRLMIRSVSGILEKGDFWSQHHHMGTTRMHSNAKEGVVDENCQVHGIANLFLAGSSVFPTSGSATPTLTIIALAMRLADQIKASKDSFL
jgi:choline dehydrogenase-like flavoprotein